MQCVKIRKATIQVIDSGCLAVAIRRYHRHELPDNLGHSPAIDRHDLTPESDLALLTVILQNESAIFLKSQSQREKPIGLFMPPAFRRAEFRMPATDAGDQRGGNPVEFYCGHGVVDAIVLHLKEQIEQGFIRECIQSRMVVLHGFL